MRKRRSRFRHSIWKKKRRKIDFFSHFHRQHNEFRTEIEMIEHTTIHLSTNKTRSTLAEGRVYRSTKINIKLQFFCLLLTSFSAMRSSNKSNKKRKDKPLNDYLTAFFFNKKLKNKYKEAYVFLLKTDSNLIL